MKTLIYLLTAFSLSTALVAGCKKSPLRPPLQLVVSKTTIKLVETDSLVLLGAEGDSVKWTVTPSNYGLMFHNSNLATALFYKAGTYTVSATSPGYSPLTKTITVLNEPFYLPVTDKPQPPHRDTTISVAITGGVVVTPILFKLPNSDSTGFVLKVQLTQSYPCGNSVFSTGQTQTNNNYTINLYNLVQPAPAGCLLPNSPVRTTTQFLFYPEVQRPITLGNSYPLTVNISGVAYTGYIIFTKTSMDITWNYTSGVTFSSKHVTL